MKRVSKKQKRVRSNSKSSSKATQTKATVEKSLIAKALHLLLGPEHFDDRAAAEKLRQFPNVPRKIQSPFPCDVKMGFVGHYKKGKLEIQDRTTFVPEFVSNSKKAWYRRKDKRGNRKPKREVSGLIETNAALSTGLSMVLADLVREGKMDDVRSMMLLATDSGMKLLCERTGYLEAYLSLHPDAEGTVSTHFGLWPIDPRTHELIGRSAGGKRGRRGLRNLGDSFVSILRHHRAIGLHADLVRQPEKNLAKRDPDDWAVGEEMDRVVRDEIGKLPNGPELLKRAVEYQREAAEDWLKRYRKGKAGVDKQHADLEAAHKRIAELESALSEEIENDSSKQKQLSLRRGISGVRKLMGFLGDVCKKIGRFFENVHRSIAVIEITYSMPTWITKMTKSIDVPNPQQLSAEPLQEARASAITFETVDQPQVLQNVTDRSVMQQEPCQESQARGVKKTAKQSAKSPPEADDQQIEM